ncbi:hypothetical protein DPV78_003907 [Talaromyces pinophilus]|nr:hypothetical protein DPV78_003907 [Talaromyces pinophilus]
MKQAYISQRLTMMFDVRTALDLSNANSRLGLALPHRMEPLSDVGSGPSSGGGGTIGERHDSKKRALEDRTIFAKEEKVGEKDSIYD